MANNQRNYYSNPAFCQQSEYYQAQQRCKSPQKVRRQSPIGAQTKMRVLDTSVASIHQDEYISEQEFYEEMIVDDMGLVTDKKIVVVSSPQEKNYQNHRYEYIEDSDNQIITDTRKDRYEYIPMKRQDRIVSPKKEEPSGRYALVPVEEIQNKNRYAVITEDDIKKADYYTPNVQEKPPPYQPQLTQPQQTQPQPTQPQLIPQRILSPQTQRRGNQIATQKLYQLLQTPPRPKQNTPQRVISPQSLKKNISPTRQVRSAPRAQQKLNYAIGTRQIPSEKRHTAIVAPICSSPVQSVYSETTCSQKSESWMNLSAGKAPVQKTLAVAAVMMVLCGCVNFGLCLYMISIMGRLYYLDFGIVAGFTCFVLGLMGFRTRNCYWLPNRNYISGYIVLSLFSLLTCSGLLLLLFKQAKQGTPLADMTSGAVCCLSAITLLLAAIGLVSSYCCKVPPPDNRVQHCARGFTV